MIGAMSTSKASDSKGGRNGGFPTSKDVHESLVVPHVTHTVGSEVEHRSLGGHHFAGLAAAVSSPNRAWLLGRARNMGWPDLGLAGPSSSACSQSQNGILSVLPLILHQPIDAHYTSHRILPIV